MKKEITIIAVGNKTDENICHLCLYGDICAEVDEDTLNVILEGLPDCEAGKECIYQLKETNQEKEVNK